MKTALAAIAATVIVFLVSTPQAEARGHRNYQTTVYVSGHMSCGTPIYRERYFVRLDRWGNPVWNTRSCRAPYRPAHRPAYRPTYRPTYRPAYVAPCPPPRPYPAYRPGLHGHVSVTY